MDTSKNKTVKAAFSADEANAITNNLYRAIHAKYPHAKVTVAVTALGHIKVSLNSAPFPVFADGTGNGESDNFRLGMGKNMAGRRYSPEMVKFWNVVLQEVQRLVPGEPVKIFYIGYGRGGYRIIGGARKRLTAKRLDAAADPDLGLRFHQQCRKITEKFRGRATTSPVSFNYDERRGLVYGISFPSFSAKTWNAANAEVDRYKVVLINAKREWDDLVRMKNGLGLPGPVQA